MKVLPVKIITVGSLFLLFIGISNRNQCMVTPKEELKVYEAMFSAMPDQVLVKNYQEQFNRLQKTFKEAVINFDMNGTSMSQLPIFKVALFKAIVNEIKRRQEKTHKTLLPSDKIKSADKLIREKEDLFNSGIKEERRLGH